MNNIAVEKLMRLIHPLSIEEKLEILSKLSEELKIGFKSNNNKEKLLEKITGSWKDINENISEGIINARTISSKEINFD